MTPFDWPNPQTPSLVQNSETHLKCELSYCDFCVEVSKFSLPWQQGLVWHKFHLRSSISRPRKPPIWRKNLDDIWYTSWFIANFVMKFMNFCYHGNKGGSSKNLNDSIRLAEPPNPQFGANILHVSLKMIGKVLLYKVSKEQFRTVYYNANTSG